MIKMNLYLYIIINQDVNQIANLKIIVYFLIAP